MKKVISACLAIMLVMTLVLIPAPAQSAEPLINCRVVTGQTVRVVCSAAGLIVLDTQLNVPTVVLPAPPRATVTQTVTAPALPQPTKTVTETVPSKTETVTVEGPTQIETVRETETIAASPSALPTQSARPVGQTPTEYVTVTSKPEQRDTPDDLLPDSPQEVVETGVGIIIALIMMILALWAGYVIGYKDSDKENTNFVRAMRDNILTRNK